MKKAISPSGTLAILRWMRNNVEDYIDTQTGEINCTSMVEAWDSEESTGSATLDDPQHIAWDVAATVAGEYEKKNR